MFTYIKAYYFAIVPTLTEKEWLVIESLFTIRAVKKGEVILANGKVCNHVSFLNKGVVRYFVNAKGKEISTGFVFSFGYISAYDSFLLRTPSIDCMDALEDTELIELSYDNLAYLYLHVPVAQIFGRLIAEKIFIELKLRGDALLTLTPEERYVELIDNNNILVQKVPQYMLASYIGVTPEHLSRIRKKISK